MKLPTLAKAEAALGEPAKQWVARCYEIACAFVNHKLVPPGSVAVYGHWRGCVAPGSHFDREFRLPFVQHGWVRLPDGRVIDPTRWVFEGREPYLYVGLADHYDEGGNEWREAVEGEMPEFDLGDGVVEFTKRVMPNAATWNFVERLLRLYDAVGEPGYEPGMLSLEQLRWLAHRSPQSLGPHALPIYRAICAVGEVALILIDNRRRVERENCVTL